MADVDDGIPGQRGARVTPFGVRRRIRRRHVFSQIAAERRDQDARQGGGPASDDARERRDWLRIIADHRDRAVRAQRDGDAYRLQLVKIAAVCVAAIEAHDRAQRRAAR